MLETCVIEECNGRRRSSQQCLSDVALLRVEELAAGNGL
jgi:hypothetical protein